MLGFLLRSSWGLLSVKPRLEGLNGVFLEHMWMRVSVVKGQKLNDDGVNDLYRTLYECLYTTNVFGSHWQFFQCT